MDIRSGANDKQKVTLVIGGMHGIPKNIARMFFGNGHRVVVIDKQEAPDGDKHSFFDFSIQVDLTQESSVSAVIEHITESVPYVSNIVFGARYRGRGPEKHDWEKEIALELSSTKMIVEGLSTMMEGRNSSIVIISSIAARFIAPTCTMAYHTVKAAINQMARYYAVKLGPMGIRVNAIAPGYIVKDENIEFFTSDRQRVKQIETLHPLRRYGKADDIANVVRFLCSREASFITGQIIVIDGGLSLNHYGL